MPLQLEFINPLIDGVFVGDTWLIEIFVAQMNGA